MMKNLLEKLESVGGIEANPVCIDNRQQKEMSFLEIEAKFNSVLPQSYKDLYLHLGTFLFLELVRVQCIDVNEAASKDGKVSVGNFYCISKNFLPSLEQRLSDLLDEIPFGFYPICDGELGDIIFVSLRKEDHGFVYYFHHEGQLGKSLFLIAKTFDDFIMKLEKYQDKTSDDELVKIIKMELSPQMLTLLKKSGYGPKG